LSTPAEPVLQSRDGFFAGEASVPVNIAFSIGYVIARVLGKPRKPKDFRHVDDPVNPLPTELSTGSVDF
jgi:hypothetical protein